MNLSKINSKEKRKDENTNNFKSSEKKPWPKHHATTEFPRNSPLPLGNLPELHNSTNYESNSFVNISCTRIPPRKTPTLAKLRTVISPSRPPHPLMAVCHSFIISPRNGDIGFPGGVSLLRSARGRKEDGKERERKKGWMKRMKGEKKGVRDSALGSSWPFLFSFFRFSTRERGARRNVNFKRGQCRSCRRAILLFSLVRSAVKLATSRRHPPLPSRDRRF